MTFQFNNFLYDFFLWLIIALGDSAYAYGVVLAVRGDAKALYEKESNLPVMSVEGKKYYYQDLKTGMRVEAGVRINCAIDCKIKIAYQSGDSLWIGPGTSVVLPDLNNSPQYKESKLIDLIYGRLRAMVSKQKNNKPLKLRTRAAVVGVRGTDFSVMEYPTRGTEVSVFNGKVLLKSLVEPNAKVQTIDKQNTAIKSESGSFSVRPLTKGETLAVYEYSSSIPVPTIEPSTPEVKEFSDSSKALMISEVKREYPEVAAKLDEKTTADAELLQKAYTSGIYSEAKKDQSGTKELEPFTHDREKYKELIEENK